MACGTTIRGLRLRLLIAFESAARALCRSSSVTDGLLARVWRVKKRRNGRSVASALRRWSRAAESTETSVMNERRVASSGNGGAPASIQRRISSLSASAGRSLMFLGGIWFFAIRSKRYDSAGFPAATSGGSRTSFDRSSGCFNMSKSPPSEPSPWWQRKQYCLSTPRACRARADAPSWSFASPRAVHGAVPINHAAKITSGHIPRSRLRTMIHVPSHPKSEMPRIGFEQNIGSTGQDNERPGSFFRRRSGLHQLEPSPQPTIAR